MNAVIGHCLQTAVINAHWDIDANLGAEFSRPRDIHLWTEKNAGYGRVFVRLAVCGIFAFGFARDQCLQSDGVIICQGDVVTRTASPGEIVRILMSEIAFRAGGILETRAQEPTLPAGINVGAENAIK